MDFDDMLEHCMRAMWMDPIRDPVDIAIEREDALIADTGCNNAGLVA